MHKLTGTTGMDIHVHLPDLHIKFVKNDSERNLNGIEMCLYVTEESVYKDMMEMGFTMDQCLDFAKDKINGQINLYLHELNKYFDNRFYNLSKYLDFKFQRAHMCVPKTFPHKKFQLK